MGRNTRDKVTDPKKLEKIDNLLSQLEDKINKQS